MARDFASGTDRINFGSPSYLDNLGAITVSAIVKVDNFTAGTGFGRIVCKESGWIFLAFNVNVQPTNTFGFSVQHATTAVQRIAASSTLNTTDTFHLCATWDGGTSSTNIVLYVNGVQPSYNAENSSNASGARTDDAASDLVIGNRSGADRGLDGQISEVGIWDAALTGAEVAQLADRMKPMRVRPQNLKFYAPSVRELIDLRGLTGTATGTSVVAHPRVY
jgi:hypothetical protein